MQGQTFYLESSGSFLLTICSDHLHYSVIFQLISQMLEDFWWINVYSPIQGSCHDKMSTHPKDYNFITTMLIVLITTVFIVLIATMLMMLTLTTIIS